MVGETKRGRWKEALEQNRREQQVCREKLEQAVGALNKCMKEREEILMLLLEEMEGRQKEEREKEAERQQEEQKQKEELVQLMCVMQEISGYFAQWNGEREAWQDSFQRQEAGLGECGNLLNKLGRQNEAIVAETVALAGRQAAFEAKLQQVSEAAGSLAEEKRKTAAAEYSLAEEKRKTAAAEYSFAEEKRKAAAAEHSLRQMREELEEVRRRLAGQEGKKNVDAATGEAYALYERYSEWEGRKRLNLSRLSNRNFVDFVRSCSSGDRIAYIFGGIGELVQEEKDTEGIALISSIVDFCIRLANDQGKRLVRQNVKRGDLFSSGIHQKKKGSQSTGYVDRVLFQGVKDDNGSVLNGCRAFVEICEG